MAKKNPENIYTLDDIRNRVNKKFDVGDIVKITARNGDPALARVIGIYPHIVRYKDLESGFPVSLTIFDAEDAVMIRKVGNIK